MGTDDIDATVLEGDTAEDLFVIFSDCMLIVTNLLDDCSVNLLEDEKPDVVMIGTGVLLDMAVMVLIVLLGIIVTLFDVTVFIDNPGILVALTEKVVTVNIFIELEMIELGMLNGVGNASLFDVHSLFEPLHFPLARLKVHSVTCLFICPPNISPYLLVLASELHSRYFNLKSNITKLHYTDIKLKY